MNAEIPSDFLFGLFYITLIIDILHHNKVISERFYSLLRLLFPRQLVWYPFCIDLHYQICDSPDIRSGKSFWQTILLYLVIAFFVLLLPLCKEVLHPTYSKDRLINVFNVLHWLSSLLFIATSINYLVYIMNPIHFSMPDDMTVPETAFEFFYYTFTLMITYSGTDVSANTIFSKTLQMIEISVFYFIVANLISSFAGRLTELNDTDSDDTARHEQSNKPKSNTDSKKLKDKNSKKSKKRSSRT